MRPPLTYIVAIKCVTFAPFQVLDESKLQQVDSLFKEFETPEKANKV